MEGESDRANILTGDDESIAVQIDSQQPTSSDATVASSQANATAGVKRFNCCPNSNGRRIVLIAIIVVYAIIIFALATYPFVKKASSNSTDIHPFLDQVLAHEDNPGDENYSTNQKVTSNSIVIQSKVSNFAIPRIPRPARFFGFV